MNDNVTNDVEQTEEEIVLTPEQQAFMAGMKPGYFMTISVEMADDGTIQAGIVPVPIDLRIIEDFQAQMGSQLAEENMKLVVVKGRAYLAPVQESSLIIPKSGLIL